MAMAFVDSIKIVNDTAERGFAIIREYSESTTRSHQQKQDVLQVVECHGKNSPGHTQRVAIFKAAAIKNIDLDAGVLKLF